MSCQDTLLHPFADLIQSGQCCTQPNLAASDPSASHDHFTGTISIAILHALAN